MRLVGQVDHGLADGCDKFDTVASCFHTRTSTGTVDGKRFATMRAEREQVQNIGDTVNVTVTICGWFAPDGKPWLEYDNMAMGHGIQPDRRRHRDRDRALPRSEKPGCHRRQSGRRQRLLQPKVTSGVSGGDT